MAAYSQAVKALGILYCELCGQDGDERNPLTRHHCSGDNKDHSKGNLLVVHRWYCHTFADYITQMFMTQGKVATPEITRFAWRLLSTNDWLYKIVRRELT